MTDSSFLLWFSGILLLWGAFWGILCLGLCGPLMAKAPRIVGLAALACALRECALVMLPWQYWALLVGFSPPAPWVNQLYHPLDWTGKVVALFVSGLVIYGLKWVTPAEVGLTQLRLASLRVAGPVVTLVAAALFADAYFSRHAFAALWSNEQVFYTVIPGLEEELFYRGVLLGLLSRAFPRRIRLPGACTSWGGVVGVALFVLGHGIKFPSFLLAGNAAQLAPHLYNWLPLISFPLSNVLYHVAMGTLFLWVREYTGSCWAAVLSHCLLNGCLAIGHAMG